MRESVEKAVEQRNTAVCSRCGLDPWERKNWLVQMYSCDYCKALVCSSCCTEVPNNEVFCLPCDYAVQLGD